MPGAANLEIYQGDDYSLIVTVLNADGTPADLTGYTAQAHIRRAVADSDPVIVADMVTVVAGNLVTASTPHTVSETMTGKYLWDIQLTSDTGVITTILAGKVTVTLEVTRVESIVHARTATV
jgi:hypothetical protein